MSCSPDKRYWFLHSDVTVLIPNYNHAEYLPQSLGAIFSQSCLPKQVIVIDDASTDESVPLIEEFQKTHPEILLIKNETNQGPIKALNRGLQSATGKYLAFCSADDQVLPGFFEQGSQHLDRYPSAGICISDPSFFTGFKFSKQSISSLKTPTLIPPEALQKLFLFTALWIPSHASLFRKNCVLECNGFDEKLHHLADWFLNVKIGIRHGVVYAPSSFGAFRISAQSYGAKSNRSYKKKIQIHKNLFDLLSSEPKIIQKRFRKSGALGQIPSDCLLYIVFHFSLWNYLPYAFLRKASNFYRKITRSLKKSD